MSKDKEYWVRVCKTEGCQTLAKPLSDYCKKCHDKRLKTMDDIHDDGSDHAVCEKCGFCIKCGDCKNYGCGGKKQ